jgi:hypothetical protein
MQIGRPHLQRETDMSDPAFWASAVARGGALGPLGDFFYTDVSRHGNSLVASLAGPLAGSIEAGAKLSVGNIRRVLEGRDTSVAADFRRFAEGFAPGQSL